jgi:hypothetical protein
MQTTPQLSSIFVPLALGCVTLIAWVSLRSDSLSSRIRSANKELVENKSPGWRQVSLRKQIELFRPRYSANGTALRYLVYAVMCLFVMLLSTGLADLPCFADCGRYFRTVLGYLTVSGLLGGVACAALGIHSVLRELDQSEATLFEDANAVRDNPSKPGERESAAPKAVAAAPEAPRNADAAQECGSRPNPGDVDVG